MRSVLCKCQAVRHFATAGRGAIAFSRQRVGSSDPSARHLRSPLIFLHALLSGRDQWGVFLRHLSAALAAEQLSADTVLVDARNHGESAHTASHTMGDLMEDLQTLLSHLDALSSSPSFPILIGHSMGGKTALLYALLHPDRLGGIVSLDASPARYSHSHAHIFKAMLSVDASLLHTRRDGLKALEQRGMPDINDRAFAVTNLVPLGDGIPANSGGFAVLPLVPRELPVPSDHMPSGKAHCGGFRWRANIKTLFEHETHVHDWPAAELLPSPSTACFLSPALFIGGSKSSRLTRPEYTEKLPVLFPNHELVMLEGGHFVHHQQPVKTANAVVSFVRRHFADAIY